MIQAQQRNIWGQPVSFFKMEGAENLNQALSTLPTAESMKIFVPRSLPKAVRIVLEDQEKELELVKGFQAIKVTEHDGRETIVSCPTKKYKHVQHVTAFEPITEGLKLTGNTDFKFVLYHNPRFAKLQIYSGDCGYESVCIGFSVTNSFDGTSALKYGIRMQQKTKTLELCGYRQVCANGMKIRVPLNEAEIIKVETVDKIRELVKGQERILHTKSAEEKIQSIQYVVEALSLLQKPVENYIKKAKSWKIEDKAKLMKLVKLHVGERYAERVAERYLRDEDKEGKTLWSLYNAITNFASHDTELKVVSREHLIDKAADMLNAELFPKIEVKAK